MKKNAIWNVPNILSLVRVALVPAFVATLLFMRDIEIWGLVVPAVIYVITGLTDMLDGKIARKYGLVTDFGKFIDPLADKFMVLASMIALLVWMLLRGEQMLAMVFVWVVLVILLRELGVTSLRLVVAGKSGIVVAASILGKIKTVSQIISICVLFIEPLVNALIGGYALDTLYPVSFFFVGVTLIFTLLSGVNYLKGGWKHISTDW
jgi:CDP-diacylglycerol--glycerol-3-phosphate 3-phosphatidyltransferase